MNSSLFIPINKWIIPILIISFLLATGCGDRDNTIPEENPDSNNEEGQYQDFLTPAYYLSGEGDTFREELNTFIHFARMEQFHHPFENESGQIPSLNIPGNGRFGAGKGPNGTSEHHPAVDLHLQSNGTAVELYAAFDGYVSTFKDAPKYRQYLSISKDIINDSAKLIGKIVILYAHIDLDLDEAGSLLMDGQFVNKGQIISRNLYSATVGGPHLHIEIRYYKSGDEGDETFYSFVGPGGSTEFTIPSAGSWSYGYWNPAVGYGFGNPKNHGLFFY